MATQADRRPFLRWPTGTFRRDGQARRASWNEWIAKFPSAALAASLIVAAVPDGTAAAQNATPTIQRSPPVSAEARKREEWRASIKHVPLPKNGCFTAAYPATNWKEVACGKAPAEPFMPAHGIRPAIVGAAEGDRSALTTGTIFSATGSFDMVTGVTSEKDAGANDNYSLQLNTNLFHTALCNGAADPMNCHGWQQFIFSNMPESINVHTNCSVIGGACAYMQYWLLNYGKSCPSGWMTVNNSDGEIDCGINSDNAVSIDRQPIGNLAQLELEGTASAISDTIFFVTADNQVYEIS